MNRIENGKKRVERLQMNFSFHSSMNGKQLVMYQVRSLPKQCSIREERPLKSIRGPLLQIYSSEFLDSESLSPVANQMAQEARHP